MIDIHQIREDYEGVKKNLEKRKDPELIKLVDQARLLDENWRELKKRTDELRHERNVVSQVINKLKKDNKDAASAMEKAKKIPKELKEIDEKQKALEAKLRIIMLRIPNLLADNVPYGKDSSENVEIKKYGEIKKQGFELKPHGELAESLGIADFDRSTKLSGAGFYFLKGDLAMLNMALIKFSIDFMVKKGYTYVEPPLMLSRKAYEGVTDLDDFENVMYKIESEDAYMIATSEHPLVSQHMDETIDPKGLPLKYAGYSICFRREIGSRGIDTKGLFRTHQFNKIEQVIICKPEDSTKLFEELDKNAQELYEQLGLPFRIVNICTGDMGTVAHYKHDLEVWFPRVNKYQEVGSCSNCTDYQARRLNIRLGGTDKRFVHTLNNTAIATSRCMVAILENYQNKDGSVTIPEVLVPYMNGKEVIKKN
ncbi:MAG: serine--tRNA ligase [Nanoarchaeota archaeon]|nr:serine--tRNA ligase [Nanoarchaeota archaeon]